MLVMGLKLGVLWAKWPYVAYNKDFMHIKILV